MPVSSKTAPHWLFVQADDPGPFDSTTVISNIGREEIMASGAAVVTGTSQQLRLAYYRAPISLTVTQIRMISGTTAAGATPTIVRVGIYQEAADGTLTLIAATPNDTTLLATINTEYTKALSAGVTLTAGQRYAHGLLVVSAAAMPTMVGATAANSTMVGRAPRLTGVVGSQADLGAIGSTIAAGSISVSGSYIYIEAL